MTPQDLYLLVQVEVLVGIIMLIWNKTRVQLFFMSFLTTDCVLHDDRLTYIRYLSFTDDCKLLRRRLQTS
jgi:hypothetical protein